MTDMATPAAATMATVNAGGDPTPAADKATKHEKPEKPDEVQYKAALAQAEKEHASVMEKLNAVKAKIDLAKPPAKGSAAQQRQQELRSQLSAIRQQQQGLKSSKGNLQEKIRQLDSTIKNRITEQKNARGRVPWKNIDEVDREIQRLEKQVDTGTMKLVDEKKALADISSLRKQRKGFAGFDEAQKGIDEVKAQLSDLRKGLDDPESKGLSDKYTAIAKELDSIKAEQDEAYKGINSLRDERSSLHAAQQEKYGAIRAIKDQYYAQKKAFADYEHEAYRVRREKQRAERETYEKEKRRKVAEKKLDEASEPAYMDEILTAEGLIRYFDPSAVGTSTKAAEPGKFAAQASRTVENELKGTRVVKRDEEDYFMGTGGKKGKKGRKGGAGTSSPAGGAPGSEGSTGGKFNLSIGVIEELGKVKVDTPMSQAEVPAVVEKLKAKLAHWKSDQPRQTKANVEKAQKEIDKLEAEAHDSPSGTPGASTTTGARNGVGSKGKESGSGSGSGSGKGSTNGSATSDEKKKKQQQQQQEEDEKLGEEKDEIDDAADSVIEDLKEIEVAD